MARVYRPYPEKHKWPKGFGSLCPRDMPENVPPAFLVQAVAVPRGGLNKLWFAEGRWCFCAMPTGNRADDVWHGFPVIGGDVEEPVWTALRNAGVVTARDVRRFRKQRRLPGTWP